MVRCRPTSCDGGRGRLLVAHGAAPRAATPGQACTAGVNGVGEARPDRSPWPWVAASRTLRGATRGHTKTGPQEREVARRGVARPAEEPAWSRPSRLLTGEKAKRIVPTRGRQWLLVAHGRGAAGGRIETGLQEWRRRFTAPNAPRGPIKTSRRPRVAERLAASPTQAQLEARAEEQNWPCALIWAWARACKRAGAGSARRRGAAE